MPRKPRQFEIGGIYHVINRGVERRLIFLKSQDYSRFILALEFFNNNDAVNLWELVGKAGTVPAMARFQVQREKQATPIVEILGFALMPNHYHLILKEISQGGISLFMRKMGGYSVYFNKQYGRVGPLFQSRYKLVSIKNDRQLAIVFAYVHTNPVELYESGWKEFRVRDPKGAPEKLKEYCWSSYRDYIGIPNFPFVIKRDFFLEFFGTEKGCEKEIEVWIKYKAKNMKLDLDLE